MQPRAASLAAQLRKEIETAEVVIEPGPLKSEFAVFVDGAPVFSRLEQGRYPEEEEMVTKCRTLGQP
jgi:selT/selW/selH-like putative selenoprotein